MNTLATSAFVEMRNFVVNFSFRFHILLDTKLKRDPNITESNGFWSVNYFAGSVDKAINWCCLSSIVEWW